MADLGTRLTDARVDRIRRELDKIYTEASKDLRKKAEEYTKRHEANDEKKRAALAAGKISAEDYKRWQKGQVFIGKQWESKVKQMARSLVEVEKEAVKIVNGELMQCFAEQANYFEFRIDKDNGFGMNFGLYDTHAVTRLVRDEPELLRRRYVDGVASEAWNVKTIRNCIMQGILQGESIPDIAKRMARDTASADMKAMTRYARTAMTGAQNAGRLQAMQESNKKGINCKKLWISALDDRTREAHIDLNGQTALVDDPFDSMLGPIMFPGDPNATDENVWNCRCALGYVYPDASEVASQYEEEYDDEEQEYEKWTEENETEASKIVEGKDISDTFERRPDQYDFAIEDVINAQGFDGLPEVVSSEEFEEIAKENQFLAQRGYIAPDKETLDAYRDQLYNGKWYVDCSHGGAMYGQGMYAGANFVGEMTEGVKRVSDAYSGNGLGYVETFTMRNPKFVTYTDINREYNGSLSERIRDIIYSGLTKDEQLFLDLNAYAFFPERKAPDWDEASKAANNIGKEGRNKVMNIFTTAMQDAQNRSTLLKQKYGDVGAYAASCGYDGIVCGKKEEDGVYVVILNRTKCVFKEPET